MNKMNILYFATFVTLVVRIGRAVKEFGLVTQIMVPRLTKKNYVTFLWEFVTFSLHCGDRKCLNDLHFTDFSQTPPPDRGDLCLHKAEKVSSTWVPWNPKNPAIKNDNSASDRELR